MNWITLGVILAAFYFWNQKTAAPASSGSPAPGGSPGGSTAPGGSQIPPADINIGSTAGSPSTNLSGSSTTGVTTSSQDVHPALSGVDSPVAVPGPTPGTTYGAPVLAPSGDMFSISIDRLVADCNYYAAMSAAGPNPRSPIVSYSGAGGNYSYTYQSGQSYTLDEYSFRSMLGSAITQLASWFGDGSHYF